MHLKRNKSPKTWPIERKGTTYLVRPNSNISKGIPLLVVLRDMLKVAQNRREVKRIIHNKYLMLNNRFVKDDKESAVLFDTITLVPSEKSYRVSLTGKGKFSVEEIPQKEANNKISKVVSKKILRGKKTQVNLSDGRNFITDVECKINDSVLTNFIDKKIEKCLTLKEKSEAIVFAGKHSGARGIIEKINPEKKVAELIVDGKKINALINQIMVI